MDVDTQQLFHVRSDGVPSIPEINKVHAWFLSHSQLLSLTFIFASFSPSPTVPLSLAIRQHIINNS